MNPLIRRSWEPWRFCRSWGSCRSCRYWRCCRSWRSWTSWRSRRSWRSWMEILEIYTLCLLSIAVEVFSNYVALRCPLPQPGRSVQCTHVVYLFPPTWSKPWATTWPKKCAKQWTLGVACRRCGLSIVFIFHNTQKTHRAIQCT